MRANIRKSALLGVVLALLAATLNGQTPLTSLDLAQDHVVVRIECGLTDDAAREWTGEASITNGEILSTWGWHFIPPDRIAGTTGWEFQTRRFQKDGPKYPPASGGPPEFYLLPNGVHLAVTAPETARVAVTLNGEEFAFSLGELKAAGRMPFLNGNVAAVYAPPVRPITRGEASHHDFPSVATHGENSYVAWVTFHNEGNFVYLAERRGEEWKTHRVTEDWGDYYGSSVAVDGAGAVHVVWSEYSDDRWRLVTRTFDTGSRRFSRARYVAPAGRRQFFHRMTVDASGRPWLVWQEFEAGNFEIRAALYEEGIWQDSIKVSDSPANDWHPAIAAAPDGAIWITWDGYEAGNYDVFLRSLRNGRLTPTVRVTGAETWDAHATVAVDDANQVWLAWEESGANWGKDTGQLAMLGIELHTTRRIRFVRYANGEFTEPEVPLETTLPNWQRTKQEYPQVAIGPDGLPYIFFRQFLRNVNRKMHELMLRDRAEDRRLVAHYDTLLHYWDINVVGFDGQAWGPVRELPQTTGRCWMQTGTARAGDQLLFVWPVDNRTYSDPHVKTAQLRMSELALDMKRAAEVRMKPFRSEKAGVADAAPTEERDLAAVRAARWEHKEPLRLFRGELHRHTDISADGWEDGDILDAYRYAMDAASLDFLTVTDHSGHERNNYFRYDWWRTRQIATMFDNPGVFTAFFGYERTVAFPGGHRNIISTRRDSQPFRISDEEFTGLESYGDRLYPYLKKNGDIAIAHTTAGGGGTNWNTWDGEAEPVVEIFQAHRGSFEAPGTPAARKGPPAGYVRSAWDKGYRLGVIAASDHRSTHQSFAGVWAPELTREAIHGALKQRRTFAATDNIIIKFEAIGADGRRYKMGAEFTASEAPQFRIEIQGTAALKRIDLMRNSEIVLSREPGAANDEFSYRDAATPAGPAYYHLRLEQSNGMLAWSSPIFVDFNSR